MVDDEKLFKLLGFAHRARKLTLGQTSTLRSLAKGRMKAIILASDVSENSESKIKSTAVHRKVAVLTGSTKAEFGRLFGRDEVGIIGILDASFAKSVTDILR